MNDWNPTLYDTRHAFVWQAGADLLDLLNPRPAERILDLGCGTGHLTRALADRGAAVEGMDSAVDMVEAARAAYPDIPFHMMAGEDAAFLEPFDAVFSNAALHWMTQPERVARQMFRALKPGGRFVGELGGRGNVGHIRAALLAAIADEDPNARPRLPWYFPSVGEYAALLEAEGFEVGFAALFDRPTRLDGPDGLRHWLRMFAGSILAVVAPEKHDAVMRRVEDATRERLWRDGAWTADYRRLRFAARRPEA